MDTATGEFFGLRSESFSTSCIQCCVTRTVLLAWMDCTARCPGLPEEDIVDTPSATSVLIPIDAPVLRGGDKLVGEVAGLNEWLLEPNVWT